MKKRELVLGMAVVLGGSFLAFERPTSVVADETSGVLMYRIYNRNSGEHFYTKNVAEKNNLVKLGWRYEGIGWYAPSQGSPVYRLYNRNAGDHHYTLNKAEKDNLVKVGWKYEGIGWYSASKEEGEKLYRAYNRNARAGSHNYTRNWAEQANLIKVGWKDEGIAWYGLKQSNPKISGVNDLVVKQTTENIDLLKNIKAKDFLGNELKVNATSSVDFKKVGTYKVTYDATDSFGNKTTADRTIKVEAVANPTISGVKDETIKQTLTTFDLKKGITAKDSTGKELTYSVSGSVDTKKVGMYKITYTTTDSLGNKTTVDRTIKVEAVANPTIEGVNNLEIKKSSRNFDYDKGVKAVDYSGKEIAYKIETSLTKNNPKSGQYDVVYTATDIFGNQTKKNQIVKIINDLQPSFTGVENTRVNIIQGSFGAKDGVQAVDGDGNILPYTVDGIVDFSKEGKNVLTYTAVDSQKRSISLQRVVDVYEVYAQNIYIYGDSKMKITHNQLLSYEIYPNNVYDKKINWSSSNESVATVDSEGRVTAVGVGEVEINATSQNGVVAKKNIHVSDEIEGNLYVSTRIIMGNRVTSLSLTLKNNDVDPLKITSIFVGKSGEVGLSNQFYSGTSLSSIGYDYRLLPGEEQTLYFGNQIGFLPDSFAVIWVQSDRGNTAAFSTLIN